MEWIRKEGVMKFYKALVEIYEDGPWTKWVVLKADYLAAEKGWKDHNAEIVAENVKIRGIVDDIRIDYLEHTLAEKDNDIQLLGDSLNGLNEQIAALTTERDKLQKACRYVFITYDQDGNRCDSDLSPAKRKYADHILIDYITIPGKLALAAIEWMEKRK